MIELFGCVQKLEVDHVTDNFDCGNVALNDYLQKYALINQKLSVSKTYVAVTDRITGFYSVTVASAQRESAPKRVVRGLPRYDVPVMLIARLAVDLKMQGKGIGSGLLKDAILRTQKVADVVGVRALLVHAKNDDVAEWYKRFDFEPSPIDRRHLFLLIKDIESSQ